MALRTVHVTIRGTRPLLFNKFGRDAIPVDPTANERTGVAGNDPEEWRQRVMADKEGHLYIRPDYVFSNLCYGAQAGNHKVNRKSARYAVAATLQVLDTVVYLDRWFPGFPNGADFNAKKVEAPDEDPTAPVYLDVRSAVNPATKRRNVRYRIGVCPGWIAQFTIQWEGSVVPPTTMRAIVDDAGKLVGLADGRQIGLGRYEVTDWQEVE